MKASFSDFNRVIDIIKEDCGASGNSAIKAASHIWKYFGIEATESVEEFENTMKALLFALS